MTVEFIILLLLGAATGGFINGLAGFGTALLSLGIWLQILPTQQAVAMAAMMSVISGTQSLWIIRTELRCGFKRLPYFILPALIGIPVGVQILKIISSDFLKLLIAILMILYSLFFLLKTKFSIINAPLPIVHFLVGFIGGILGSAASLSGVIPTMWCTLQTWSKSEISAILRPYNVVILSLSTLSFIIKGYYSINTIILIVIVFPVTIIFSKIGITAYKKLNNEQFRNILVSILLSFGIILMVNAIF